MKATNLASIGGDHWHPIKSKNNVSSLACRRGAIRDRLLRGSCRPGDRRSGRLRRRPSRLGLIWCVACVDVVILSLKRVWSVLPPDCSRRLPAFDQRLTPACRERVGPLSHVVAGAVWGGPGGGGGGGGKGQHPHLDRGARLVCSYDRFTGGRVIIRFNVLMHSPSFFFLVRFHSERRLSWWVGAWRRR